MYSVITDHPIAETSLDHTHPGGTMMDNSRNQKFNDKLYALYPHQSLRIMDLGCAGGGFVKNCVEDGHDAVGLEGSDYSLIKKRAEWATIPNRLFVCDITRPFEVQRDKWGAKFDVITAWEVMEHIREGDLPQLQENVRNHLAPGGIWIMSVSTQVGFHHVTIKQRPWWEKFFVDRGWQHHPEIIAHFDRDWVRGPWTGQNAPQSFHLIVSRVR